MKKINVHYIFSVISVIVCSLFFIGNSISIARTTVEDSFSTNEISDNMFGNGGEGTEPGSNENGSIVPGIDQDGVRGNQMHSDTIGRQTTPTTGGTTTPTPATGYPITKEANRIAPDFEKDNYYSPSYSHRATVEKSENTNSLFDGFANSELFAFIAGFASILGLVITFTYPAQIRNINPSEYRSLRWGKTLLISFGVSIMAGSLTQFLFNIDSRLFMQTVIGITQNNNDNFIIFFIGSVLGVFMALLEQQLLVWILVFCIGVIILNKGTRSNPIEIIVSRLNSTRFSLENDRDIRLKSILKNRDYEVLSTHEKNLYEQTFEYYTTSLSQLTQLLTGSTGIVEQLKHRIKN